MRRLLLSAAMLAGFSVTVPAFAQDADAGQRVFNQCRACHTIDKGGRNGVGPNLWGVVGRKAASIEGFRYSSN
ncbi:MAG: c-type cytochrome, partial [bacterium]